jgi:hypothetical protein
MRGKDVMWKYIIVVVMMICIENYGQGPAKQFQVKINSGQETIHEAPVTLKFQNGDVATFKAIVSEPFVFSSWSGDLNSTQSTATVIIDKPVDLTINYVTTFNFTAELWEGEFMNDKTFEFEVFLNCPPGNVIMTEYQVALDFNHAITSDLTNLTFSYIEGSSEFNNEPVQANGIHSGKLTFAVESPLTDTITTVKKRLGRFKLVNTVPFLVFDPSLEWNFEAPVNTIIGENGVNITGNGEFIQASFQR